MSTIRQEDSFKHQGMRRRLIMALRDKHQYDEAVLTAMSEVPRHFFFDAAFVEQAYSDIAFQIGARQTISHPSTVAYQSTLLEVRRGDKVLEIGTGSGYQTCVLVRLGAKVFTVERQQELYERTKEFLPSIGYNAKFYYGDGYKGLSAYAPFDRIVVTCGAPYIPEDLKQQLKVGGRLVIPVGEGKTQVMTLITRSSETDFDIREMERFSFVPMLSDRV